MPLDDNSLAMDAFREIGPGRHYLGSQHTLANYETAYYDARLSDNNAFEHWQEAGSLSSEQRANKVWKQMLAEYQAPPIDEAVDEALREFVTRRKTAAPDAWH